MKATNIFGILFISLIFGSFTAQSAILIVEKGGKVDPNAIELVNHTHYGDLQIEKGKQLIIDANEHLIVDGDLIFEPNSKLDLQEGASLIVTGEVIGKKSFKANLNGFMLAKETISLKKRAKIDGLGKVRVNKAVHLENRAKFFDRTKCQAGPGLFDENTVLNLEEKIAETNMLDEVRKDKDIQFDQGLFSFRNRKMPMDPEPLILETEIEESLKLEYSTDLHKNAIYLRLKNAKKDIYKISLNDSSGKILNRKLAYVDESTLEHEEEILSGIELAEGMYYIKVNNGEEQYVLPFNVK